MKVCKTCNLEKPAEAFYAHWLAFPSCHSFERKRDPQKYKARDARTRVKNLERAKRNQLDWYWRNRDAAKARHAEWKKENRARMTAYEAERNALKLIATPGWSNKRNIEWFYELAEIMTRETGVEYHVDHIVPLRSDIVCGLHWEGNLCVLTATENRSKSNRYWPDMP